MLTALLHLFPIHLAAAGASSPPDGEELHFLATVQAAERTPPPMRPPTQSGASDISVGENNASGVGGEVGPDAVG